MTERQLLAIFVSDVVGYSRLIAQDEAWTVETLRQRHKSMAELVDRHGGSVLKLVGDGMVAGFTSAVRAVECAVAIQQDDAARNAAAAAGKVMIQRIGVNLGEVVRADGEIYGDGINVAARLEALAPPGGISISSKVHDEVAGRLGQPFTDKGEQTLKNIPRPVRVFEVNWDRIAAEAAPVAAAQPAIVQRRGRPWALGTAAAVVTALALLGYGWFSLRPTALDPPQMVATAAPPASPIPAARPQPYGPDDRRMAYVILPVVTSSGDAELNARAEAFYWAQRSWSQNSLDIRTASEAVSERYRNRPFDPKAITDEQKMGFVIRTTARRAGDGLELLFTVYDRDGQSILERREAPRLGDDARELERLAQRLMTMAFVQMRTADIDRGYREHPDDPDARDLFMRAQAIPVSRENWRDLLATYDKAISLWPDYQQVWSAKAGLLWDVTVAGWDGFRYSTPADQRPLWPAFRHAMQRWRSLTSPNDKAAYTDLLYLEALGYRVEEQLDLALASIDGVLRREPERFGALRERGLILQFMGQVTEAANAYEQAAAINDMRDSPSVNLYAQAARSFFFANRDDAALTAAVKAFQAPNPSSNASNIIFARQVFVAIQSFRGNEREAKRMIELALAPTIQQNDEPNNINKLEKRLLYHYGRTPEAVAAVARLIDGLRKAGWPE